MAEMTFDDAEKQEPSKALVPATSTEIVVEENENFVANVGFGFSGEILPTNKIYPQIQLVQSSSKEIPKNLRAGDLVYAKEIKLADEENSMNFIVIKALKFYREYRDYYDKNPEPKKIFFTARDAQKAGFSIGRNVGGVGEELEILALVSCPEKLEKPEHAVQFPWDFEGKKYTIGKWLMGGGAFDVGGRPILSEIANHEELVNKIELRTWNVTIKVKSNAKNSWYVPIVKVFGNTSATMLDFIQSIK